MMSPTTPDRQSRRGNPPPIRHKINNKTRQMIR